MGQYAESAGAVFSPKYYRVCCRQYRRPVLVNQWTSVSYKAESAGRVLVKVDRSGTSQTCVCGTAVPKTLRSVGMNVRPAGFGRLASWSARKLYSKAPGSGVRGMT
jgi:hypothetical protein